MSALKDTSSYYVLFCVVFPSKPWQHTVELCILFSAFTNEKGLDHLKKKKITQEAFL